MLDSISKSVDAAEARPKERFSLADMPFLDRDFESLSEFSSESNVAMCAASLISSQSERRLHLNNGYTKNSTIDAWTYVFSYEKART